MENEANQLPGDSVSDSNGTTSSELKARFDAGSVPLNTDFAALIDMAECGRRAVGKSADQTSNKVGQGLQIAADSDAANKGKLSVKADKYIKVSDSGVTVDVNALFPMGMIVAMNVVNESDIPAGWALCDGRAVTMRNGNTWHTPDLRDRFIIGGMPGQISRKGGSAWNWADSNNTAGSFSSTTDSNTSNIEIGDHTLKTEHIPPHVHELSLQLGTLHYQYSDMGDMKMYCEGGPPIFTGATGGGESFSHHVTDSKHSHTVSVTPPFQVLAYIMKL
ncbi:hypothetical protein [Caballeronia sp. LZ034LL]|uniref:hypothetical protein n=1 Tax=Caballeronia sp. LZ034LL TaxID=3038567 RepID=UPI00286658EC|nr:hypothetical protein [Caballeronia sp. LZ034LL]MDR5837933.1 hypothetical protein [Caballeronia sp. LZ034LL]